MQGSRIILFAILGLVAFMVSIWLGVGVATNQSTTLLQMTALGGFVFCLFLGQRVWLLFLFLINMEIPLIQGFGTKEFGQFVLIGFSALIFLMRKLKLNPKSTELDFWRFAVALMIVQVYIRNPVGLNMFGSSAVGAKPYFIVTVAFFAGMVLSKYKVPFKELKWMMPIAILGNLMVFPANRLRFGGGGAPVGNVAAVSSGLEDQGATRIGSFNLVGELLSRILISRLSPLKACVHPFWGLIMLASLAAAAASGYRNTVANVGMLLLVGIAYRGGIVSVVLSFLIGAMGLVVLAMVNVATPLPANVQRALSPFPGTWEERYVADANNSSDWRYEMWSEALFTEKWIENKIIGDGLGFSRRQLEQMKTADAKGGGRAASGLREQQENMMIQGSYHSGPVQSIRTIGYVGFVVMLLAMIRIAVHAHRQIIRCRHTEWFPMMLFFGVPMIVFPVFFTFVFGTFDNGVVAIFLQSGLLDLISKNLPLPEYVKPRREPYVLMTHRNSRALQG